MSTQLFGLTGRYTFLNVLLIITGAVHVPRVPLSRPAFVWPATVPIDVIMATTPNTTVFYSITDEVLAPSAA
ncbi:hypothetical protein PIB30_047541 [Stylosanthes scabra]|uniref:Uncharacterized protein n=1 Tax=Stylosanthes scabra TaxID=79078 RepID=A0ABU6RHD1_9FABA|nr:hypothetical protein [Stylosanthes scabra]